MGKAAVARGVCLAIAVALVSRSASRAGGGVTRRPPADCRVEGALVRLRALPEASGLAASRRVPGRLWSHNDGGPPVLFSLDVHGVVTGRVEITAARVVDWEAMATARCGAASCLYVGDIGDNDAARPRVTVYRMAEPAGAATPQAPAEAFHARYPEGPRDAETLLVSDDGRMYIVTKGNTSATALYRFPEALRAGATVELERVGSPRPGGRGKDDWITDGVVSGDGKWVILRTHHKALVYAAAAFFTGRWDIARTIPLTSLHEVQGEGIALGGDDSLFLVGEGGGGSRPGTFAHLRCSLP